MGKVKYIQQDLKYDLRKTREFLKNYYSFQNDIKQLTDNIRYNEKILNDGDFDSIRHLFIKETVTGRYNNDSIVLKAVIHKETEEEIGIITDREIRKYFEAEIKKDMSKRFIARARVNTIKNALRSLKTSKNEYLVIQLRYLDELNVQNALYSFNKFSNEEELTIEGFKMRVKNVLKKIHDKIKNDTSFKMYQVHK